MSTKPDDLNINDEYKYGFRDPELAVFKTAKGISPEVVAAISAHKKEPQWMLDFRLQALQTFFDKPMPKWGNTDLLNAIDFDDIYYYLKPTEKQGRTWDEVPEDIKNT